MVETSTTIMVCLPKELELLLTEKINEIFKEFGRYRTRSDKDGIYYNIPHITLLSMGDCYKNKEKIAERLALIVREFKPIQLKSKKLVCFDSDSECHVVIEMDNSRELQAMHEKIYYGLKDLSDGLPEFALDKFRPHITIIASIPKKFGETIKSMVDYKPIEFTANAIAIKFKEEGKKTEIYKVFELKS
jgi:2'-5' RNA ligase